MMDSLLRITSFFCVTKNIFLLFLLYVDPDFISKSQLLTSGARPVIGTLVPRGAVWIVTAAYYTPCKPLARVNRIIR
jgi:hypothetical protein